MAFFAPDIGIDLGTSNTMVYVRGRGIVISEPTIVVTDANNRRNVRAVGDEARYLLGRTTASLAAILPMRSGTIADFDMTECLIRYFIRKNLPFCIIDQIQTVVLTGEKTGFYQNGGQLIILQHLNRRQILVLHTPILRIAQRIQLL